MNSTEQNKLTQRGAGKRKTGRIGDYKIIKDNGKTMKGK